MEITDDSVIRKFRVMNFHEESYPCPAQFTSPTNETNAIQNPFYSDWIDEASTILLWINSTISDYVISHLTRSSTSYELWRSVEERFSRSSSHSIQLKQGDKSVCTLLNEIKIISDQLVVAGSKLIDDELVVVVLPALNSNYNSFATSIRIRNPPVTSIEL